MNSAHILIIDDDPDFVEIMQSLLETRRYRVSCAYNMNEGFAKLEQSIPDVIILDIMMGKGAEGFIFARKIRKDSRFAEIPIVMLTSMREQRASNFPESASIQYFFPLMRIWKNLLNPKPFLMKLNGFFARMGDNPKDSGFCTTSFASQNARQSQSGSPG